MSEMSGPVYYCETCKRRGSREELRIESGWVVSDDPDALYRGFCEDCRKMVFVDHPREQRPATLFDRWSSLNTVGCDWRSRFDELREKLPLCKTLAEARSLLVMEGFDKRYPELPERILKSYGWLPK